MFIKLVLPTSSSALLSLSTSMLTIESTKRRYPIYLLTRPPPPWIDGWPANKYENQGGKGMQNLRLMNKLKDADKTGSRQNFTLLFYLNFRFRELVFSQVFLTYVLFCTQNLVLFSLVSSQLFISPQNSRPHNQQQPVCRFTSRQQSTNLNN